jgi:hypothetical protein
MPAQHSSIQLRARWRGAVALGHQHRAQGDGHHARQAHVQRIDLAGGHPEQAGAEHQRGVEAGAPNTRVAGIAGQQHAAQAAQARPQARLPFAEAERRTTARSSRFAAAAFQSI